MRILIAPDKFKGSLTAAEAAAAIAEGALRVYPDAVATQFPIADGGEGTLEAAVAAGYEERLNAVVGPILAPLGAAWAIRKDDAGKVTAVIETAQASGLAEMEPTPDNALRAHSYGCGQLIAAALEAGATEIVLGLGGSAMSDGGSGALRALGLKPLDSAGNVVPLGGGSLADVVSLDATGLDPRLSATTFRIAVDVRNPLYGPTGAAHVFSPQKGADDDAVELLDAGLRNWASVLREATGRDVNVAGAGAAGGFPASFLAFTDATLEGGFALVAGLTGLAGELAGADLVITGEGSMDSQSLTGKAPIALADAARERGIPVIVVAGRILVTLEDLTGHGVVAAAQLLDVAPSPEDAIANAGKYLTWATTQVLEGA
ncbi:Glycerate kinase [Pseudarthrobacter chlorophenolicus A6]|uniref:Glycerate kinase n=1 Tax=Pseudarthrobacter chlorophenolicus (strain ATCC 700700 / DSM 12829 / CIP 107037 / JCM 12360 / KCTC 9906 / NCIMB 13794 / A6) TaxID=452863 RepID=B8H981_PSECP|nr:glycerate kinase [Pseudarthrobacter chlorophenolicus]ACL38240.1 Glycerate kinase [Pseudarthrobacter chlorophenolicus A6]SDQ52694.1 glycerate kinase [Pseudarthrobacter chlorophenolicus]